MEARHLAIHSPHPAAGILGSRTFRGRPGRQSHPTLLHGPGAAWNLYLQLPALRSDRSGVAQEGSRGDWYRTMKENSPGGFAVPEGMVPHIHLSLSDEPPLAQAFVVIEAR